MMTPGETIRTIIVRVWFMIPLWIREDPSRFIDLLQISWDLFSKLG